MSGHFSFFKKQAFVFLLLSGISLSAWAQESESQETLFGDFTITNSGGYGGPAVRLSAISGDFAAFFGGYGGWYLNKRFMIGGGGFGLVNNLPVPLDMRVDPNLDLHYDMGYGGFMFEYVFNSDRILHLMTNVLVGGGGIEQDFEGLSDFSNTQSAFFVFEPGAHLEVNVAPFFRVAGGITYRLVSGSDTVGIQDSDLSSMSVALSLKFGYFD
ncbi:hypothetical protein OKW21_003756 [Catalinimonas alkaloidigena]|uniref:hypothetical protein n=1 Tax=Catalinimonas alkaloidigena TaxID=1075417 RepID=UPI0024069AED|nr:hypothetical protein [Catalinimonas alkaloidigena]MDF9798493.1 hypothetical protein [Catalinimonas alkaloidigena]